MPKQKDTKQTITLTPKQFKTLLKAVYLGNWMANAYRTDKQNKEYKGITEYIFSFAPQFGFGKYVDNKNSPTTHFEETTDVHEVYEEYDNETLWDELAYHLGERDFLERYSEEEMKNMSDEEYSRNISDCIHAYHEEFEAFGWERLRINGKKYDEYE